MAASLHPPSPVTEGDLVAGACAQVARERNLPQALHLARALSELGRALGYQTRTEPGATETEAEVVWERAGANARRLFVRGELAASQVLRAVPPAGGPPATIVITAPDGVLQSSFDAVRKVIALSRPDLKGGDLSIVHAPPGALGRVWQGDLKADVLERGRLKDAREASRLVGPNPGRDRADFPLFPYEHMRDGQRALLRDVRAAVESRKVLVAHAPTGIGKTAAVLGAAIESARAAGKTVFFLTNRQTQHQVAVRTLQDIAGGSGEPVRVVDLTSKQSMCPRPERPEHSGAFYEWCAHLTETRRCKYFLKPTERALAELGEAILGVDASVKSSARLGCCPYKVAVEASREAEVLVCDYNTLFDAGNGTLDRIGLSLGDLIVIVDEAHNLPERIRDASGGRVTHALLAEAAAELDGRSAELAFGVRQFSKIFEGLLSLVEDGKEATVGGAQVTQPLLKVLSTALVPKTYDQFVAELLSASRKIVAEVEGRSATLDVALFLRAWTQPEKDTLRLIEKRDFPALSIALLDPAVVAGPLFAEMHAAVLMSGTLFPMSLSADLLGIPPERRMLESYPSPFLASRRPVLLLRGVSTRYKDRGESMFGKIAAGIEATARATPGNVAVFFPSYKLRDDIGDRLPSRLKSQVVIERREMTKGEKDRIVQELKRAGARGGALLLGVMGGSFSEGVDFYDGILQAVVVVGLPLAPPSKEVDVLIDYFERKVGEGKGETYAYLNPAITRVLQAAGRLIRREEDRGVVVLMDERLEQGRYERLLPPDFAPRALEDAQDLGRTVQAFFEREG